MPTIVQSTIDTTNGASPWTTSFTNGLTTGNCVVGIVSSSQNNSMTISDGTNTYTTSLSSWFHDTPDGQYLAGFYKLSVTGGSTVKTITYTQSGAANVLSTILEVSGLAALNGSIVGNGLATAATSISTTAIGAAGNFIAAGSYFGINATPTATGTGMILLGTGGGGGGMGGASYNLNASGAVTPGFSWTGSSGAAIVAMAFTASAAAASCTNALPRIGAGCGISVIGWTPALLRSPISLFGGAALRLNKAIRRNAMISRRTLLTGHNGGPKL